MNFLQKTVIFILLCITYCRGDSQPKTVTAGKGARLSLTCSQGPIHIISELISSDLLTRCKPMTVPPDPMKDYIKKACEGKTTCVVPPIPNTCRLQATYVCRDTTPKCGGQISGDLGVISIFGRDYGNPSQFGDKSIKCEWKVHIPSEEKTKIIFKAFNFPHLSCIESVVTITSKGKSLALYCNSNSPLGTFLEVKSNEFQVQVNMNLKKWTPDTGFKLQYYPASY